MTRDLAEEIEQAVAANQWVEENPALPGDRFERCSSRVAAHGGEALQPLTALLADADPHRRATAAYLLGRLGEAHESLRPEVRAGLRGAIPVESEDQVVQALAVGASLAGLDRAEALGLLRSPNANLRRVAAYNLAMVVWSGEEDEPVWKELGWPQRLTPMRKCGSGLSSGWTPLERSGTADRSPHIINL